MSVELLQDVALDLAENEKLTGILLVNLGTPDSSSPADVYRYLIEFLTDPRVIDTSWLSRQLLVRSVIVPMRYKQSAKSYKEIWMEEGSPLKVYGYRVKALLQERLGRGYAVELAMRYRSPSIGHGLDKLANEGCGKIIVLPLFPQYASATTGSVHQAVMEWMSKWQNIPKIDLINGYPSDVGLIRAFVAAASHFKMDDYDHILLSFHGLPKRQLVKADRMQKCCLKSPNCCKSFRRENQHCYSAQCFATAAALTRELGLPSQKISISFQSRLGKEPWLEPYTSEVIIELARKGKKKILVFCPSFVCDCLETIYEMGVEYAEEFKKSGGEVLDLVPGLNDREEWIEALYRIVKERCHDTPSSRYH